MNKCVVCNQPFFPSSPSGAHPSASALCDLCISCIATDEAEEEASTQDSLLSLPSHEPATPLTTLAPLENTHFFVMDTETTGLCPKKHRVIEIAIVSYTCSDTKERVPLCSLVNPGGSINIPPDAYRVHGITADALVDARSFRDVWAGILSYVNDSINIDSNSTGADNVVIIAHRASFDAGMVAAELQRAGIPQPAWRWACTVALAQHCWPSKRYRAHSLETLKQSKLPLSVRESIGSQRAHRAAADVQTLCHLLDAMKGVEGDAMPMLADKAFRMSEKEVEKVKHRGTKRACEENTHPG